MTSLDTNILARFYVEDPTDPEAAEQRPRARALLEAGTPLYVPVTVVLELEWVMRAFYRFGPADFSRVIHHLAGLSHVRIEDWPAVLDAVRLQGEGLDLADALHLTRSVGCDRLVTFDDQRFARRARRLGTNPPVETI